MLRAVIVDKSRPTMQARRANVQTNAARARKPAMASQAAACALIARPAQGCLGGIRGGSKLEGLTRPAQRLSHNTPTLDETADVFVYGVPRNQQGPNARRIICYGDSNTVGFHSGGRGYQPYGQTLAADLASAGVQCEVIVCGLCSYTSKGMLDEKDSEFIQPVDNMGRACGLSGKGLRRILEEVGSADLVIIMTGTNDIGSGMSTGSSMMAIKHLHAMCHEFGAPTIAVSPTSVSFSDFRIKRQVLVDKLVSFATSTPGVLDCIDVEELLPGKESLSANWEQDGLHMSSNGSLVLGRRLAPHVRQWLRLAAEGGSSPRTPSPPPPHVMAAAEKLDVVLEEKVENQQRSRSRQRPETRPLKEIGNRSEQKASPIQKRQRVNHEQRKPEPQAEQEAAKIQRGSRNMMDRRNVYCNNLSSNASSELQFVAKAACACYQRPVNGCALAVGSSRATTLVAAPMLTGRLGLVM